jgi:hypothetical protein
MPQARRAGSSPSNPAAQKSTSVRPAAGKPATAKRSAAKPAANKQAAKRPAAKKAAAAKPTAAKGTSAKAASGKTAGAKGAAASKGGTSSSRPRVNIDSTQVEAIAERLRKLNEKIIDFGREAGENTLASYEKALKTIANGVQQSPAKDELEWISHLAASQAKFVRELTDSWAKAARDRLK